MKVLAAGLLLAASLAADTRPLLNAVQYAWELDRFHVVAPQWFESTIFEYQPGDRDQVRIAIEQKFALVAHFEVRPVETYILRVPKFGKQLVAATSPISNPGARAGEGYISGRVRMWGLAQMLEFHLHHPVVDETDLDDAYYEIAAKWDPREPDSIMRAFREQVGLELEKEMREEKVLIVDSARRDTLSPAPPPFACEPIPELRHALDALPRADDDSVSYEQRIAPRRQLAEEYSGVFPGMALQQMLLKRPHPPADDEWALALFRRMDDHLAGTFLEGRLNADRALLRDSARRTPDFPWTWFALAELDTNEALELDLRNFRKLCPASPAAAALYDKVHNPEELRQAAAAMTPLLKRNDDEALAALPHLWRIWQRIAMPGRITIELFNIRTRDLTDNPLWYEALKEGYLLTGDSKSLADVQERILYKAREKQ